jgi:deazaflavin-dependent oxidoreductase (nitroreductase family)
MWFDPLMAGLLRSPLHALISRNTMLITVRGRKTTRALTTPVNYVRHNDELLTVSFRSRTWWRNVRGRPTPVEVRLAGARRTGRATVVESDAEVAAGLAQVIARSPATARYMGMKLGASGQPDVSDLARAARPRVVVRTVLDLPA